MKNRLSKKLFVLFISLFLFVINSAVSDPIYREIFTFSGSGARSHDGATTAGWYAIAAGKEIGKYGLLKVSPSGSPTILTAVSSKPSGPLEGNSLWTKPLLSKNHKGLLFYTDEFNFLTTDITNIFFQHRVDGASRNQQLELVNDGARIAFKIGAFWYISDQEFRSKENSKWTDFLVPLDSLTFGTTPYYPNVGPRHPQNSGVQLPAGALVTSFGLFYYEVNGRIRLDNFTLQNSNNSGEIIGIDPTTLPIGQINPETALFNGNGFCINEDGKEGFRIRTKALKKIQQYLSGQNLKVIRDKPMIELAATKLLSLHELSSLRVNNVIKNKKTGLVTLKVGSRAPLRLSAPLSKALIRYISRAKLAGLGITPLFRVESNTHEVSKEGLCPSAVKKILEDRAIQFGFKNSIRFVFP